LAGFLVFFASGAVLVLETVSLRLVGPYIGVTLQVTSAVIGVSLLAIAYGAWGGGWMADRRNPRHVIAPVLVLAAIATGITLPVVRYAGEVLRGSATTGILLLTGISVFIPILLLSMIPPLVVKLQLGDLRRTGQVIGKLSSISTLGAVTATLITGFVLVAALPSSVILMGLAACLGVTGLALAVYQRQQTRPRTRAVLAIVALMAAGTSAAAPHPCDMETAYHCASVTTDPDNPHGRILKLNSLQHSYVDLSNPAHLEFAYLKWMAIVAETLPPQRDLEALHLGGGGFTFPRYLMTAHPRTRNMVFEIDGGLVDIGERLLGLRTGPQLQVRVGDARMLIGKHASASADLVVGDAFGYLAVPWHLTTREMALEIKRVMRPGAIYVQNVIDYPPSRFIKAEMATVASVFPYAALIAPQAALEGKTGSNFVIVASREPLLLSQISDGLATLPHDQAVLLSGDSLAAFVGTARVLTDDYAPVDQLLSWP
jgi:spermidine synthase